MTPPPALPFWDVHVVGGESRQTLRRLVDFERQSMGGGAGTQWNDVLGAFSGRVLFAELPADFSGDWHENPAPQWIVPLTGAWWVETMDARRVEMGPGEVSFGGDQGSEGAKGHRSGVVGEAPCRLMIVQLDRVPEEIEALRRG